MRTITSSGPTWVAEIWSSAELLRAGWTEADLEWEDSTVEVMAALGRGDPEGAKALSGKALRLAREAFGADDPRLGTSLANHACCLKAIGDAPAAGKLLAEARLVWQGCGPWIARMTAPRVARSSLFHMRMEQRHRDTYEDRWRDKWQSLVEEAQHRLKALENRQKSASAGDCLARWERERPAMLNDTRKLLAAVTLIAPGA